MLQEYQQELSQKEEKMIQNILQGINDIIQKVAKEKQVKLVMEKQNVIYGGYDMTADVKEYIQNHQDEISADVKVPESN